MTLIKLIALVAVGMYGFELIMRYYYDVAYLLQSITY